MEIPVNNLYQVVKYFRKWVFRRTWNYQCKQIDYWHKLCKEYKKIDWSKDYLTPEEFKRIFPVVDKRRYQFRSWYRLRLDKKVRTQKEGYSIEDAAEEMLRNEISCHLDDLFWYKSERYYENKPLPKRKPKKRKRKRRKRKKGKRRAPFIDVSLHINGLVHISHLGKMRDTPLLRQKMELIKEEFAKRPYIFDRKHPLFVSEKQIRGFFTNYYLNHYKKYESLDAWIEQYCWAEVHKRKIAGYKSQGEKRRELYGKKGEESNK